MSCACVFSGQTLAATERITACASSDPSLPITRRIDPLSLKEPVSLPTRTEQAALHRSCRETLPRISRAKPERPWEPTTSKSGCHQSEVSKMTFAGAPRNASEETAQNGKYERMMQTAISASFSASPSRDLHDTLPS